MPNGKSNVEVILKLGPGVSSEPIHALRNKMKDNDGELELPNGATARLTAIEIVRPGMYLQTPIVVHIYCVQSVSI